MSGPDPMFAHPRLAAVYDAFDGYRDDLDAYRAIAAEFSARLVADIGCGTGTLAVLLAADGRTVIGVDPAAASLAVARRKDPRVAWVCGDAGAVAGAGADLAVMTGNVAQVFLTDDAWAATLLAVVAALAPGGRFVFETRRPDRRAWEEWTPATVVRDVPGIGRVERHFALTGVSPPFVSFGYRYAFPDGEQITSASTLRFRDRDEIERHLAAAGLVVHEVREAPDRPGREFVFVTQRQ